MSATGQFDLSPLESEVLRVIASVGLQVHLWFPIVQRGVLGLKSEASDEQIHAGVVALARKRAIKDVETGCLNPPNWVAVPEALQVETNSLPSPCPSAVAHEKIQADAEGPYLSLLETQIIRAIDHVGWFAYLWFPKVQRELMDFGSEEPEEKVHSTLVGLTRKRLLLMTEDSDGDPVWNPTATALESASNSENTVAHRTDDSA